MLPQALKSCPKVAVHSVLFLFFVSGVDCFVVLICGSVVVVLFGVNAVDNTATILLSVFAFFLNLYCSR